MDSSDFRNPNVWLKTIVEKKDEIRSVLKQVRAIPITAQYDITILNQQVTMLKRILLIKNLCTEEEIDDILNSCKMEQKLTERG